jgi:hypothetical protein
MAPLSDYPAEALRPWSSTRRIEYARDSFVARGSRTPHPPRRQRGFGGRWVVFDTVDGLSGKAGFLDDARDADRIVTEHVADHGELLARVARAELAGIAI